MNTKIILPEEQDNLIELTEKRNALKLMDGGKGGNWLAGLGVGTEFLCKWKRAQPMSNEGFILMQFKVANRIIDNNQLVAVLLITDVNQEQSQFVEPVRFCNLFDLVVVMFKGVLDE